MGDITPFVINESKQSAISNVDDSMQKSKSLAKKPEIADALLQTMDILSNAAVNASPAKTLTLEAKITKIIDEGRGIYKVKYLDNLFEAKSINETIKYKVDDIVYIIVPEGNFDKEITILSAINSETSKASTVEGPLRINIGESLYGSLFQTDLCSFREEEFLINGDKSFFAKTFINYLKDYRTFDLSCYINTNIAANRRSNGNYGLVLSIPVVDANGTSSNFIVTLDANTITGNAYNFTKPALQNLYFTIPEDISFDENNLNNLSLKAFVTGFPDQHPKINGEYDEENYPREKYIDIWITNIGVYPTKVVTFDEKQGYYLKLRATEGSLFWDAGASSKELYPDLYLNGRTTSAEPFECYWFKENYRVGIGSDNYYKYGGIGWEILNKKEKIENTASGQSTYKYVTNKYKFPVTINEIYSDLKYKCVLVKDDIILTDTIILRNIVDPAELILTTDTGSNIFTKGIGDVTLIIRYHDGDLTDDGAMLYEWKRFNKYEELITDDNSEIFKIVGEANTKITIDNKEYLETKVTIPVKYIYDLNTIFCTAYKIKKVGEQISETVIGTSSLVIRTQDAPNYKVVLENADRVFKYDSDGDSPMSADYDGPISSKVNAITPISVRAYKDTGEEFTEAEYNSSVITWKIPKNSMIVIDDIDWQSKFKEYPDDDYYIVKGDYVDYPYMPYIIDVRYDKSKTNNTIKVNVTMQNLSIDGMATIKFLKDGESGTNGSKYTAIITHGTEGRAYEEYGTNGEINKLQLVYVEADEETMKPKWYLFNNGFDDEKLIEFTNNLTLDQINKWTQFDVKMYCDGVPIDASVSGGVQVEKEWHIFDYQNQAPGNIMSPIDINSAQGNIQIKMESPTEQDPYSGVIRWPQGKICCATLEVKCKAVKSDIDAAGGSEDKSMFEEFIYAYYPIEITYSRTSQILGENKDGSLVPRLDGGFSNVIYSSDGKNPKFDTTSNFIFVDNIPKETEDINQDYTWNVSGSLLLKDVIDTETGRIKKLEKEITPSTTRYPDGSNNQYVQVNYGYEIDPDAIADQINNLIYGDQGRNFTYGLSEAYRTLSTNSFVIEDFKPLKSYILDEIESKDSLLKKKMDLYDVLREAIERIMTIQVEESDAFNSIGTDYLNSLYTSYHNVFNYRLIAAVNYFETMNISNFISTFETYGSLTELTHTGGDPQGVLIDIDFISGDCLKENITKKRKNAIIKQFEEYNHFINTKYAILYDAIVAPGSIFNGIQSLMADIKDKLLKYIGEEVDSTPIDTRWPTLAQETYEITLPQEWESDPPTITIENPSYSNFKPIYENIKQKIINMTADKLKSTDDILDTINFIEKHLFQYYGFHEVVYKKVLVSELALNFIEKEIEKLKTTATLVDVRDLMHIKPIIMVLNRYELSHINGWDGNKLVVDEDQGYILSPQLGAGMKENGRFTGVIMGVYRIQKTSDAVADQRVGLFGWSAGEESIFLNARTGSATFGTARQGRITIDPGANNGQGNLRIVDSLYTAHEEDPSKPLAGMCISFTGDRTEGQQKGGYIHFGDAHGKIYSGNHTSQDSEEVGFYLSHDGFSIGDKVNIKQNGNFTFGNENSNKYIKWENNDLIIGPDVAVTASNIKANVGIKCGDSELKSDGAFNISDKFKVDPNGNVTITGNANITGRITCDQGSWIGNWLIRDNSRDAGNGALYGYSTRSGSVSNSTIHLIPNKGVIGFKNGAQHTTASGTEPDYTYIGGMLDDDPETCNMNLVCIYPNLKKDGFYGDLRARGIYSDFGLFGRDKDTRVPALYLGCHGNDAYEVPAGKGQKDKSKKIIGAIKITMKGIYQYQQKVSDWVQILDFSKQVAYK